MSLASDALPAVGDAPVCYRPAAVRVRPVDRGPLAAIQLSSRRLELATAFERATGATSRLSHFEVGLEMYRDETDLAKLLAHTPLVFEAWLPSDPPDARFAFTYVVFARVVFERFREMAHTRRGYSAMLYGHTERVVEGELVEIPEDVALPGVPRDVRLFTAAKALTGPPFEVLART